MADFAAVVLAAGQSRRLGGNKLLHPLRLNGRTLPLVLHSLRPWLAVFDRVTLVVRPQAAQLDAVIRSEYGDAIRAIACKSADGMGHSLAAGVAANPDASGWLIGLADMPLLQAQTIAALRDALRAGAQLAAPFYQGRRGHPVGFAQSYQHDLIRLRGDRGARDLLARQASALCRLSLQDAAVLRDVDTPEDLHDLTQQGENT